MNAPEQESLEARRAYLRQKQHEHKQRHERIQISLPKDQYADLLRWYEANTLEPSLPKQIKRLVMDCQTREEFIRHVQTAPDKETIDKLLFVLRNFGNNLNQIARHLNTEAKQERRVIVAGKSQSETILNRCHTIIEEAEQAITDLLNL